MSCLPDLHEWSQDALYSLLEAHFEAMQGHMASLTQAFQQGAVQVLDGESHYHELHQLTQESLDMLHELRKKV